ncbi:MAG TPA: gliding motility-associated C-terminal domain-containing protein [Bacteroidales bacterium]|nr:gliding motility-associated C-terminal domain-containing protein [Bacteroidales bacterium]
MKKGIQLAFTVWLMVLTLSTNGQNLPQACGGTKVRYEVDEIPGSVFQWDITGGTLLKDNNNSVDIMWDHNEGIHMITVTQHSLAGCQTMPVYGYVMVASPTLSLEGNTTLCEGETAVLKAKPNYLSITWNTGSKDSVILVNQPGYYKAEATFPNGCKASDSVYLAVNPSPAFSMGNDTVICNGDDIILDPGIIASSYLWSTGETTPTIRLKAQPDIIWVKITNNDGCSSVDTIQIKACPVNQLKDLIPNAFTPNNDNDNDFWRIDVLISHPGASVSIYNRWGQLVYKADKNYPSQGWDGTSNGRALPMDTYFYIIDLKDGSKPILGSINIIR